MDAASGVSLLEFLMVEGKNYVEGSRNLLGPPMVDLDNISYLD